MSILKDVSETGELNLASSIVNSFTFMEVSEMQRAIREFSNALPNDNLTAWAKENGIFAYTSQALVLNSFANALNYQLKNLNIQLDKVVNEMKELSQAETKTEFWDRRVQGTIERLAVIETNLDNLDQVFTEVKKLYEQSTGNTWTEYIKKSEQEPSQVSTASALELENVLAKYA